MSESMKCSDNFGISAGIDVRIKCLFRKSFVIPFEKQQCLRKQPCGKTIWCRLDPQLWQPYRLCNFLSTISSHFITYFFIEVAEFLSKKAPTQNNLSLELFLFFRSFRN